MCEQSGGNENSSRMALSFCGFLIFPTFEDRNVFLQIKYLPEGRDNSNNIDSRLREIGPIVGLVLAGIWLFANHVRR